MLLDLYVKNFALIESQNLEFEPKLTVISGETGAGKSLTVDALGLLLGGKADSSLIYHAEKEEKKGEEGEGAPKEPQAEVIATFDVTTITPALHWLEENALLETVEANDYLCILRRVISSKGRSRNFINGRAMPLHALKGLGELLVDIHGQHAHQSLMKPSEQRRLVDDYAGTSQKVLELGEISRTIQALEEKLATLKNRDEATQDRINFLTFQLNEFTTLKPQVGEWEMVSERFDYLSHFEANLSEIDYCLTLLSHDDKGINRQLQTLAQRIEALNERNPLFANLVEMIENALILTSESENELHRQLEGETFDQEEYQQIENRMQALNTLARKHRIDPEKLPEKEEELTKELASYTLSDEALLALKDKIAQAKEHWRLLADEISELRLQGARELNEKITHSMQELAMEGGQFMINLIPTPPYHLFGNESLEFLVSANPGQPLKPLGKVASGGELARISLSISVILSMRSSLPTLIFDEVDTGVGGAVAEMIGQHLQNLSQGRQVFCVTHLPQVASFGHHHFKVSKETHTLKEKQQTKTTIKALNSEERVDEIARMLGGVKLTDATYQHAKEMLNQNHGVPIKQ